MIYYNNYGAHVHKQLFKYALHSIPVHNMLITVWNSVLDNSVYHKRNINITFEQDM